jgi:hypothetical protein
MQLKYWRVSTGACTRCPTCVTRPCQSILSTTIAHPAKPAQVFPAFCPLLSLAVPFPPLQYTLLSLPLHFHIRPEFFSPETQAPKTLLTRVFRDHPPVTEKPQSPRSWLALARRYLVPQGFMVPCRERTRHVVGGGLPLCAVTEKYISHLLSLNPSPH